MIASLKSAAVTLPLVLSFPVILTATLTDPHILLLTWPDGHEQQLAATSQETCEQARYAIAAGLWRPGGRDPASTRCTPGNLFSERSLCIAGYSCPRGMQ